MTLVGGPRAGLRDAAAVEGRLWTEATVPRPHCSRALRPVPRSGHITRGRGRAGPGGGATDRSGFRGQTGLGRAGLGISSPLSFSGESPERSGRPSWQRTPMRHHRVGSGPQVGRRMATKVMQLSG